MPTILTFSRTVVIKVQTKLLTILRIGQFVHDRLCELFECFSTLDDIIQSRVVGDAVKPLELLHYCCIDAGLSTKSRTQQKIDQK